MRIETLPLIIGVLIAMLGIGIMFDAWTPDVRAVAQERRRRARIERHRNGEAMIGLGVLGLAAAFIGRDSWRYSILVVVIGAIFLVIGAALNAPYMRQLFVNRGPLRRRDASDQPAEAVRAPAAPADTEAGDGIRASGQDQAQAVERSWDWHRPSSSSGPATVARG